MSEYLNDEQLDKVEKDLAEELAKIGVKEISVMMSEKFLVNLKGWLTVMEVSGNDVGPGYDIIRAIVTGMSKGSKIVLFGKDDVIKKSP